MSFPSDAFFQLVGPRWKLAKAICIHEQGNKLISGKLPPVLFADPLAVGDNGDAQGLFQLHAKLAQDYVVPAGSNAMVVLRGVPFASINIMTRFIVLQGTAKDADVIGAFHDGHEGWIERGDRDSYVATVVAILARL